MCPGQRIPQGPVIRRFSFGMSPAGRDWRQRECCLGHMTVGRCRPPSAITRVTGVPANPDRGVRSGRPWQSAVRRCRQMHGGRLAQGSQGPRVYRFSAQRVRVTRRRKPGEVLWAVYRQNRDGSEPRYYLSNAPPVHLWRPWPMWAAPAGALKPSSRPRRATWAWIRDPHLVGLASPHRHVPAGRGVPVDPATGLGGKRCP